MCKGPQSIEDFRQNTGTVSCRKRVSTNKLKNSRTIAQVSKEGAELPCTVINYDNIKHAHQMVLLEKRVTIDKLHIFSKLVTLECNVNKHDGFLDRIITDDKAWIQNYEQEC